MWVSVLFLAIGAHVVVGQVIIGRTGATGRRGPPGYVGPPGPRGMRGEAGSGGGQKGMPGQRGPAGSTGWTGRQGRQGITGARGFPGRDAQFVGSTGSTGMSGRTGVRGPAGEPGRPGSSYGGSGTYTGRTGATGYPGVPGQVGYPGSRGQAGYTGPSGPPGEPGMQGPPGQVGELIYCSEAKQSYPECANSPNENSPSGPEPLKDQTWVKAMYKRWPQPWARHILNPHLLAAMLVWLVLLTFCIIIAVTVGICCVGNGPTTSIPVIPLTSGAISYDRHDDPSKRYTNLSEESGYEEANVDIHTISKYPALTEK